MGRKGMRQGTQDPPGSVKTSARFPTSHQNITEIISRIPVLNEGPLNNITEVKEIVISLLDGSTRRHSKVVAVVAGGIAQKFKLPQSRVELIKNAGELHDVGKIAFTPEMETKIWANMTLQERGLIKKHPVFGANIVSRIYSGSQCDELRLYILHHHERWNGSGYPSHFRGPQIPFGSRILAVADAYVALTEHRLYRKKQLTKDESLKFVLLNSAEYHDEIQRGLPTHLFDANSVEKLLEVVDSKFIAKAMAIS
jgi:putative nucleotidyltransferase with HDIG domain